MKSLRTIGITMGDPHGIGPEIVVKALHAEPIGNRARYVVFGSASVMQAAMTMTGFDAGFAVCSLERLTASLQEDPRHHVVDAYPYEMSGHCPGRIDARAGQASFAYIKSAIEAAIAGNVDAVVTGPIHKEAIHLAGYRYAGHTEIFKDLTGAASSCMMLAHDRLHVSHVTTHVALRDVPELVTKERVANVIRLTHSALCRMGYENPAIAVAGLNPHCGENGLFGMEDRTKIAPAVQEAIEQGIRVTGPLPGDTVFVRAKGGEFDAVVAMYHDQGHIPLKLFGFRVDAQTGRWEAVSGVNITLGLPIVRTSVDHGVAFDIAWQNKAKADSMADAVDYAIRLTGSAV